jgi:uroporphyrinogen-III synthase
VLDYGGVAVERPLIVLQPEPAAMPEISRLDTYDWLVVTSPSSVRCLLDLMQRRGTDLRRLPRILVNGPSTAAVFAAAGIQVDAQPASGFAASDMMRVAESVIGPESLILRLRSDKASEGVADSLRAAGHEVQDCQLYVNAPVRLSSKLPGCDAVFFASGSAVDAFVANWGVEPLRERLTAAIGRPTAKRLAELGITATAVASDSTAADTIQALAAALIARELAG